MKILMVNKFHYRFGGAETYYFGLSDLLRKAGHTVIPFAMHHPLNEQTESSRFFVRQVDLDGAGSLFRRVRSGVTSIYSFEARRMIRAAINEMKPDLVHIHNYNFQITPSILYEIAHHRIPVVQTLHDPQLVCPHHRLYDYNTQSICERCAGLHFYHAVRTRCIKASYLASAVGAMESYLYHALGTYRKCVNLFISPSEFLRAKTMAMGFRGKRIEVIENFVDTETLVPGDSWGRYCLYAGRVSSEKGLATLVAAMRRLRVGELVVAGDGPMKEALAEEVTRAGAGNVRFVGRQTPKEVYRLIRESAFVVVPSEWYENMPLSVMEAFSCGKAVVASSSGGLVEMVTPGETGLLFPPGDVNALTACLSELFGSRKNQEEWGSAARRVAEKRYNKETHKERILAAYGSVLAS